MIKLFQILVFCSIFPGLSDYFILTAQTDTLKSNKVDGIEVVGLVIDETASKLGKDFFDLVYNKWDYTTLQGNLSIFISEKPLPSLGSQISVSVEDNIIFQQVIRPNEEALEELSNYVVVVLMEYLQNYEQIQKDLAGGELQGTGIY